MKLEPPLEVDISSSWCLHASLTLLEQLGRLGIRVRSSGADKFGSEWSNLGSEWHVISRKNDEFCSLTSPETSDALNNVPEAANES